MEETIIMNIKRNYILWMAAWLMPIFLGACSDELAPAPQTEPESTALCFAVKGSQTRLGYDYETTTFNDGETVGCVIAEVDEDNNYTYLRNSAWTYRASDGMLIFQYYWGQVMIDYGSWSNKGLGKVYTETTEYNSTNNDVIANKIIQLDPNKTDKSYLYSPYLEANQDKKLIFCFYYPYVDGDLLEDDVKRVMDLYNSDNTIQFYQELYYPNIATNVGLTFKNQWGNEIQLTEDKISDYLTTQLLVGTVIDDTNNANNYYSIPGNKYGWRTYPCFVNHTQGAVTGSTYNDPRLHKSDFLWVASPEISATTQHTVNLTFLKKTATILVYSEVPLNNIYFTPNDEHTLLRGKQIDLATGELSDYNYNAGGSVQQKNMYFNPDEHIVPCYRGVDSEDGEQLYFYRLVLPAQADCRFKMHIEADFNGDGNTQVAKEINLSDDDKLTELKEGYMYSIRISKSGKTVIRINDWKDGGWAELE